VCSPAAAADTPPPMARQDQSTARTYLRQCGAYSMVTKLVYILFLEKTVATQILLVSSRCAFKDFQTHVCSRVGLRE
jgi:hypothetical protein